MVAPVSDIKIVKPSPASREEARAKVDFDQSMMMLRHQVDYTESREAAEYFFRELMRECGKLSRRFGLKLG